MNAVIVRTVREADGATCRECGACWGTYWPQPVPWSWRKSQLMHQQGTGHRCDMFRVTSLEGGQTT